ncbi:hypothetical protein [Alteribacter lacisalsi]|uniref:hypothetical protein n=1 Tax=Alteribacter lacisalsi TaxID=2045244 RepID=UPI001374A1E3|nr:hypothetical protein [Alteribacter lacisalsi]
MNNNNHMNNMNGNGMNGNGMNGHMDQQQMMQFCQQYMHHMMQLQTQDGQMVEGIINGVDENGVHMLVPDGDMDDQMRFYGGGFGGGYGGYGYPRRFRRWRPFFFPYYGLGGFFFPFFL